MIGTSVKNLLTRVKNRRLFRNISIGIVALMLVGGLLFGYLNQSPPQAVKTMTSPTKRTPKPTSPGGLLAAGWKYMPGVTPERDGLLVEPRNFMIVEQNGTGGQPNPPINLYGTRLQVSGDFALTARIAGPGTAKASIQLYGGVPTMLDEFRIEPKSVRFTLASDSLTIQRWDGGQAQAALTQTFPFAAAAQNDVRIERRNGTLAVSINGSLVGSVPEQAIFKEGAVWFGLSSENGSWRLKSLKAIGLSGGTVKTIDTSTIKISQQSADGLQALALQKRPGFLIGAAAALAPAVADDAYAAVVFGGNFGSITTENVLKWQFVHPSPTVYDFREADALVALANRHGLKVHAHTLVFAEANPRWVREVPVSQREQVMLDHIKTVVGHYKGKVNSWDVVNEPFDDEEWDQLRPHLWYQAMGESYITKAFVAARAADPTALLFINDYGLEEDGDRWNAFLALVTKLKKQGVPIDGVGFQAHVYERSDKINPSVLRKHIQQLAAIGVKARVSEMDVYIEDGQATQADQYTKILQACLAEPNCTSFTTWGVSDRYDWFKDDDGSIQQGQDYLWDSAMHPTPAVMAIQAMLRAQH